MRIPEESLCVGDGVSIDKCTFLTDEGYCLVYGGYRNGHRSQQCLADFPHGAVVELKKKESEQAGSDPKEREHA